jgi:hypothetical protein
VAVFPEKTQVLDCRDAAKGPLRQCLPVKKYAMEFDESLCIGRTLRLYLVGCKEVPVQRKSLQFLLRWCVAPLCLFLLPLAVCAAEDELKYIHNPGGGEIVYGPVTGQTTLPGAMGVMLRNVHSHFGDRPQVGKFFHANTNDSVAAFFTVAARSQGGKQMAGLVIVANPAGGGGVTGALIYDDAQRFATSANPMMNKLNEEWQAKGARPAQAGAGAGAAAALSQTPFPDNSGSIGLPAGWRITSARGGVVHTAGPNGESLHIGIYVPVMDTGNPQTRAQVQRETGGGARALPGMYVAYPFGDDPFRTLQAIDAQLRAKQNMPQASFSLLSKEDQGNNCTHFRVDMDAHDGKGVMFSSIVMCVLPPKMAGSWAATFNQAVLPKATAEQEIPTVRAMMQSYRMNGQVIQAETQQTIDNIHRIGAAAKAQADSAHAANDAHNASVETHWDQIDRQSKAFSNYQLDQTQLQDSLRNERGTVSNAYADALVKADPNRYQYVGTQDFLKGVDY